MATPAIIIDTVTIMFRGVRGILVRSIATPFASLSARCFDVRFQSCPSPAAGFSGNQRAGPATSVAYYKEGEGDSLGSSKVCETKGRDFSPGLIGESSAERRPSGRRRGPQPLWASRPLPAVRCRTGPRPRRSVRRSQAAVARIGPDRPPTTCGGRAPPSAPAARCRPSRSSAGLGT